jgi:hypothetical protein
MNVTNVHIMRDVKLNSQMDGGIRSRNSGSEHCLIRFPRRLVGQFLHNQKATGNYRRQPAEDQAWIFDYLDCGSGF